MNTKRIIQSSAMLIAIAAITIGGTGAFFSDTEQSTGNVFTAGAVDLTVDHTSASYNGEVCVSSGGEFQELWQIGDVENSQLDNPADEFNFVAFGQFPPFADPFVIGSNTDDEFPWNSNFSQNYATDFDVEFTYSGTAPVQGKLTFSWAPGTSAVENKQVQITTGSTNESGTFTKTGASVNGWFNNMERFEETFLFTIEPGVNTLNFTHTSGDGTLWDWLKVEALDESEPGVGVYATGDECQLFEKTDLTDETFFNFSDVKPQDSGMNVVSLHVESNEAYACMNLVNKTDAENTINDPENTAGDSSDPEGELGSYLTVKGFYSDANGNEVSELFPATLIKDLGTIVFADSTTGNSIAGNSTEYVKFNWCMGDFNSDGSCDGNIPDINQTQTDSFLADLQFSVVQTRNNENFVCESSDDDEDDDTAPAFATSTGTGFPTEGSLTFTGEGRIGNSAGTATGAGGDQELKLGTNINNSSASVVAQFDMGSDSTRDFTLSYASSTQIATLVLTNGTDTETLTYNVGTVTPGSALYFIGKNNQSGGPLTELTNLQLNGQSVGGTLSLDGTGSADIEFIKVAGSDLSEGFVATGTVLLDGNSSFAAQLFQVQVRN